MPKNKQNTLHKGAVTFLQQLLTWEILQALIQSRKTFVILCNIFPGVALKIKKKKHKSNLLLSSNTSYFLSEGPRGGQHTNHKYSCFLMRPEKCHFFLLTIIFSLLLIATASPKATVYVHLHMCWCS